MKRNTRIAVFGVLVGLILLGVVARVERSRWIRSQNAGIAQVRAAVSRRFDHPAHWRGSATFMCLVWPTKVHQYGRELCYAASGAIVEAIERTPDRDPRIWTLRPEPGAASVRDNPQVVAHLLDRLGAQTGTSIQVGKVDRGPEQPPQ